MIGPLERLSPRAVLAELRTASWDGPVRWSVMIIPTPWLTVDQIFYGVQSGLAPASAVGYSLLAVAAYLTTLVTLLWVVTPIVARLLGLRSGLGLELAFFSFGGIAAATVMVWATGDLVWERWIWLTASWALNAGVWTTAAAVLVSWWVKARDQRARQEAEYRRQVLTRTEDARALATTDRELAAVRAATRDALADIESRLRVGMTADELDECIRVIDEVVAGSVRPTSHDLARMAPLPEPIRVAAMWRSRRELVPAIVRSWPIARPFQPALVGILTLPMVMVAELVPPPHRLDSGSAISVGVLAVQLVLLWAADKWLAPQLLRIPARGAVGVVYAVYVMLYLFGMLSLVLVIQAGAPAPLEAFLVPSLLAMVSGGISAFSHLRSEEASAARALIRRTNWEVHRTRQQLWARRRRLALTLHGRVQANLTAASLMLGMARAGTTPGTAVDPAVIEQVRGTVALADVVDQTGAEDASARLETVSSIWRGVLDVSLTVRPRAAELLSGAPDLTDACVEVVREILLNSVRHSGATHAEVIVGAEQAALLGIRVREHASGRMPLGAIGGPGLGRTLIDSLAVDWAESDTEDGRTTVALLAAGRPATATADARSLLADVSSLA